MTKRRPRQIASVLQLPSAAAALDFAFSHLELPQVVALSVPANTPSHTVLHRISPKQWRLHTEQR